MLLSVLLFGRIVFPASAPPPHPTPHACCRRLLIRYTDWMPAPNGAYFRFINSTLTCTGNITFPLPAGGMGVGWVDGVLPGGVSDVCAGGGVVGRLASACWPKRRAPSDRTLLPACACCACCACTADFKDSEVVILPAKYTLIGLGAIALVAMAVGIFWYHRRSGVQAGYARPPTNPRLCACRHACVCPVPIPCHV